jgi:hypothetical protein
MGNILVVEKGAGSGGVMKHFQIHGGHRHKEIEPFMRK